ncbi:AMP-binding protein [Kocuria sp.]|uniref:AMP-binding protein n=1 Tax=Kocuria sp. TaxID=1871328 RepID=UPI0026E042B6|nr:AMP-binding protein [Kocuria sp.]MDO5617484.1 AMP-binding protein [Kocuria sp.]
MNLDTPHTSALPRDTVILDGPESVTRAGGVTGLLSAFQEVLQREGPAVVVATSGSTGRPKRTVLSTHALKSSAQATAEHLAAMLRHTHHQPDHQLSSQPSHNPDQRHSQVPELSHGQQLSQAQPPSPDQQLGHGQWLLCLPPFYVAGVQVLIRSVIARTTPVVLPDGPFTAQNFVTAAARMTHPQRFVSLVPTQLQRLVDAAPNPTVRHTLRSFTAILLGGSAATPHLLEAAHALGANVITTYGMSETAGGCVYDDLPLPGVSIHLEHTADDDATSPGRIWLGGPMVTDGYLDDPAQTHRYVFDRLPDGVTSPSMTPTAPLDPATRWYRTDDLGVLTTSPRESSPRLRVIGRADDVMVTGGVKVSAGVLRNLMVAHPGVRDVVVVPVADPQWGQRIVAALVPAKGTSTGTGSASLQEELRRLESTIRQELGPAAVPKQWLWVPEIPLLPTGKPDRAAVMELFVKE